MIGKKNIVFGFIFLALSAALGPYMIATKFPDVRKAGQERQTKIAQMQNFSSNDFVDAELKKMSAEQIARANTAAILAITGEKAAHGIIDSIKGGPHAHGNLESLLNIAVGLVLAFLAVPALFKQIISWTMIAGTVLHSGMLYLAVIFGFGWAMKLIIAGPPLVLAALVMTGVAAAMGFKGEVVRD